MKKIFLLCILISYLTACSIQQEIALRENGQVYYSLAIDASQVIAIGGLSTTDEANSFPKDTIISFRDLLEEKDINLDTLSVEEKDLLTSITPLSMRIRSNMEEQELFISYYGDFENIDALNKALKAIAYVEEISNKNEQAGNKETDEFKKIINRYSQYHWDKNARVFSSINQYKPGAPKEEEEDIAGEDSLSIIDEIGGLSSMLGGGKFKMIYTFPYRVKETSNPKALLSNDGKSVIIEYPSTKFIDDPQISDISIHFE